MIDGALGLVTARLNAHLAARYRVSDDLVVLSPLSDAEGKPAAEARNRLVLFLVNIAHDATPRRPLKPEGGQVTRAHPLHLDIYFMLASGHDPETYLEGLKLMSAAMMFFQTCPVMNPQTTPDMPPGLEQLSIEISNLRIEELGQLWGNLGGRYVPSVMFKMRSVIIDAAAVGGVAPLVTRPGSRVEPREDVA
ncbi:DUF4255 domain-containing protein [Rhodovulum steppense]|uniref:Uncharacterized protein DUF4255 n=1 Tax=Rhodovulum steppense TaxID=540251 RepID=A0A4R1YY06_9RHOB|nr:DUF4255 domain-containing protein [Rhodovulum steppense]TCM86132.1 uncharacterized protein DUF4255 [Rhodovulum steppense]